MLRSLAVVLAFASVVLAQGGATPPSTPAAAPEAGVPSKPAQDPVPTVPAGAADLDPVELAKAMNATMLLAAPGPQHEKLAAREGYYEVEMALTPPGVPPQTFAGEARAMTVLGGRYLLVNLRVKLAGVMLEGLYLFGFDNLRQRYTMSWRDSMSTWAVECAGKLPETDPDRVPLQGMLVDAASPTGRPFEVVMQFRDDGLEVAVQDKVKDAQVQVMTQRFVRKPDPRDAAPKTPEARSAEPQTPEPKGTGAGRVPAAGGRR